MPEVYVKFNSLEEAMAALQTQNPQPVQQQYAPPPPPQPQYAPQPQAPAQNFAPPPPQQQYAPAPQAPAPAAPAAGGITSAQVAAQAQAYAKAHGAKNAKAIFAEFGANAVKDIPPEHYAAAIARMAV